MATTVFNAIAPPERNAPRYGLVAALGGETGVRQYMQDHPLLDGDQGASDRWAAGTEFAPYRYTPTPAVVSDECSPATIAPGTVPAKVAYSPYLLWEAVKCSTFSYNASMVEDRASKLLLASTSFQLEREFWNGTGAGANGWSNDYLRHSATLTQLNSGVATPLRYALAYLQASIATSLSGSRGMIHCTPFTASLWYGERLIEKSAGLLVDAFDNVIVAGSGYDGSSPAGNVDATGDTAWAYATSMVGVRLGRLQIFHGLDRGPAEGTDDNYAVSVSTNVETAVVQRDGIAYWDQGVHSGVLVDLCQTFCSPG